MVPISSPALFFWVAPYFLFQMIHPDWNLSADFLFHDFPVPVPGAKKHTITINTLRFTSLFRNLPVTRDQPIAVEAKRQRGGRLWHIKSTFDRHQQKWFAKERFALSNTHLQKIISPCQKWSNHLVYVHGSNLGYEYGYHKIDHV